MPLGRGSSESLFGQTQSKTLLNGPAKPKAQLGP